MSSRPTLRALVRTAVTPRWLCFGFLATVMAIGCVFLGRWQWERTQDIIRAEQGATAAPIPIETVAEPDSYLPPDQIGRPATAAGRYLAAGQVVILSRSFRGEPGVWVVTPLKLTDGSVIAVLRGWLPDASSPGVVPPTGLVMVTGTVQPDENFYAGARTEPGEAMSISSEVLRGRWAERTRPGYLTLAAESPSWQPAPKPVPPTVVTANVAYPIQNIFYAIQWLVFAGFGALVYGRWLWRDAQG